MPVNTYLREIGQIYSDGNATEHSYRPALKTLFESLYPAFTATNEPKRVECGTPDHIVSRGAITTGYIEAKDIGKNLNDVEKTEQLQRYFNGLSNLLLTDYLEFRLYHDGELIGECSLGRFDAKNKLRKSRSAKEDSPESKVNWI